MTILYLLSSTFFWTSILCKRRALHDATISFFFSYSVLHYSKYMLINIILQQQDNDILSFIHSKTYTKCLPCARTWLFFFFWRKRKGKGREYKKERNREKKITFQVWQEVKSFRISTLESLHNFMSAFSKWFQNPYYKISW